ncbi:Gfo/Idh/MocA family oxidoreductase [Niastella caeni]|uniref:Gfo/Idh/MocA family oxidoreductase n=1 Tax=Niastella caeni TaxID=2569763 RepID=A0A4S8HDU9_9BACT|nr:Gfo/Idh/MocA family oxidoreductase [Niastella caeni]THU33043.1 Gfo/Idh/MocA family oxidoreductase [Niastella caeni]
MKKIRWGILSTAKIAREKVIPAMQRGRYCEIAAIASRNPEQAKEVANGLKIPTVYGSYEELLNDPAIDAVYIPLPNHLHVEWSIKSIQAGKHVLCEKPIALSSAEATQLLQVAQQNPQIKVMEAFMYRFHPQWVLAKELVDEARIGQLKTIHSFFSYYNADPNNIRNKKDLGGGGMMDIGCYCVSLARFLFNSEPVRVQGHVTIDPVLQTDTLASGILEFAAGTATFTCSTQLMPYQRVQILGTEGRVEIEIPFNAPPDQDTRLWLHTKNGSEEMIFEPVDQYTLQGDLFAQSILNNTPVPTPLQDAINNMKIIEAVFATASH